MVEPVELSAVVLRAVEVREAVETPLELRDAKQGDVSERSVNRSGFAK